MRLIPTLAASSIDLEKCTLKDYGSYSYWLETSDDDLTPRPPLDGSIDVDVAILGAGFTGLWTAYHLLMKSRRSSRGGRGGDRGIRRIRTQRRLVLRRISGLARRHLLQNTGSTPRRRCRSRCTTRSTMSDEFARSKESKPIYAKGGELEIARADYDLPEIARHV